SAEDRADERKVPTEAHRAIASLAAKGHVRVILTTNFDRLTEQALDAESVPDQVISSPDDVDGMRPLIIAPCTVIKINGDCKDLRIKNTDTELADYEPRMGDLLDRVISELGLIVCGWSGDSDPGLRRRMLTGKRSSFGAFWTHRSPLSPDAREVLDARGG